MSHNIIVDQGSQYIVLHDPDRNGKDRPWVQHRMGAEILSMAYRELNPAKSARLDSCSQFLGFDRTEEGLKLKTGSFCRVRLCPMCQWRRSLKLYGQTMAIVSHCNEQAAKRQEAAGHQPRGLAWIMITLTQASVEPWLLGKELTNIHQAWQRLTQRKAWKSAILGWMRATEITRNATTGNYHPHIHAILAVQPSYFKSRNYISQAKLAAMWAEANRLEYVPVVDIRKAYGTNAEVVSEIAKYAAKPSDYLDPSDISTMEQVVLELDSATAGRRFCAWGGCMAEAHKVLDLDDVEDGDLLHVEMEQAATKPGAQLKFTWYPGPKLYIAPR